MPVYTVEIPEELGRFINDIVASGRYYSVDEVIRAALQLFESKADNDEVKALLLQAALEEGEASGIFEGDPFEAIHEELGLHARRA